MTITNANAENQRSFAPYASRMDHGFDARPTSLEYEGTGRSITEPFETAPASGAFDPEMYDAPYELHLPHGGEAPKLTLYKPERGSYPAAPQAVTPRAGDFQPILNARAPVELPGENDFPEQTALPGEKDAQGEGAKTMGEISEETECPVCENRKYQDGSADPGVSLKFATKLSPYSATAAVRAHEYQHVRHHQMEADKNGRKIISQTVMLKTRRCPHCGKMYTSGGVTKTVTAAYKDCAQMGAHQQEGQSLDKCV